MIRKNFVNLSLDERGRLANALNSLWQTNVIQNNAALHETNFHSGIHMGPAFLPWHRDFLRKLEKKIQEIEPSATLPFWDWTRPDSRDLDKEPWKSFFGGRANTSGNFDHWSYTRHNPAPPVNNLPTASVVLNELSAASFLEFRRMEYGSHVPGHNWTGGSMANGRSPLDPLFYLHHGNVDRLWSIWQLNNPGVLQYDHVGSLGPHEMDEARVPLSGTMVGGATPESMLDHAALGYSYDIDHSLATAWLAKNGSTLITAVG